MMRQTFFESFQFHVVRVWMTHISIGTVLMAVGDSPLFCFIAGVRHGRWSICFPVLLLHFLLFLIMCYLSVLCFP